MIVRFGIWHDRVSVYFMDFQNTAYTVEIDREANELRLFIGGSNSVFQCFDYMDFPWRLEDKTVDRTGFSRCGIMGLSLVPIGRPARAWCGELPLNHNLEWPHARDCGGYLKAEELMRECVSRRDSARLHGVSMPTPPGYITMALTPEMRVALFT